MIAFGIKFSIDSGCRGDVLFEAKTPELAYTELLFDVCDQFGIHYYSADKKARAFVEEVTRVTWAKQQEEKTGVQQSVRPAFTA